MSSVSRRGGTREDHGRWGLSGASAAPEPLPEPLEWRSPPPLRERISRAVTVPTAAAVVVFTAIVLVAVAMVWLQPSEPLFSKQETGVVSDVDFGAGSRDAVGEPGSAAGTAGRFSAEPLGTLLVHVVGEVQLPGVVELEEGSRVADAIEAAGGATDSAMLAGVNLARPLADGEQIFVPNDEQAALLPLSDGGTAAALGGSGLVNLNTADSRALETLPRVGPALAQRIISWREANGGFTSVDQLLSVSGIGARTLEQLRELVTV